jgi:PAS domain S-box-containing protein
MIRNFGFYIKQVVIALLLLLVSINVNTFSEQTETNNSLSFKRLTTREGMPASAVNVILQDSRGFMWFGTGDGLVRYDGHDFRVFRPDANDPNSISHNSVLALKEDSNGDIWVGTDEGGLNLWHREAEKFIHYFHDPNDESSLSDNSVSDLLINDDGTIWVSTIGGGLNLFDPKTGRCERFVFHPDKADSLDHDTPNDNLIRIMMRSRQGIIWLGTNFGGLNRFDPQTRKFQYYEHDPLDPESISHNRIDSIAEGVDGTLWLGTEQGLCCLDPQSEYVERFEYDPNDALQNPMIESVFVDSKGNVLAGTDGGGLYCYDPVKNNAINIRHNKYDDRTLVSNVIRAIYQDDNGDFWMGHFPSGVSYANKLNTPFRVYRNIPGQDNSLSDDRVLSVIEEDSGNLWVGTDRGGLNYFDRASGQWTHYKHDPNDESSLGARAVVCLLKDHKDQLWVGAWNGGLNKFDPETGTFLRYLPDRNRSNSLHSSHIWRIVEDHEKRLWVGTVNGGIARYLPDEDGFISYRHDPADPGSISHDSVWSIQVMRDGTLWAGTSDGICRWEPSTDSWKNYYHDANDPQSLSFNMITDMLEDHEGRLWIATAGGGINRFDNASETFEYFTVENGLPSNMIRGFIEDQDGFFWLLTNNGLCRFDRETHQCRTYDENVPGTFTNGNARYLGCSGEIFIGSTEGLTIFNPQDIHPNDIASPLVLTRFEIFNQTMLPGRKDSPLTKSITETNRIEIPSIHSMISFQFALLNYRSSSRNQYKYMLEGFDTNWRISGPERRATYTNLFPGHYKFRVKAANNEGVWSSKGVNLELIVLPLWWQAWWIRWGIIVGLLGIVWIIASWRSRLRLREAEYERKLALERQQAAEALNKSEMNYREIFNATNDGIAIHCLETGDFLDINDSLCRMSGYTREEILQIDVGDLSQGEPPYSNEDAISWVKKTAEEGVQEFEWLFKKKSGEIYWIDVTLKRVVLGGKDRILAVDRDITERKRAEEILKTFKSAVEASSDAIGMSTPEGKHYYQNKAYDNLFGEIGTDPPASVYVDVNQGREIFDAIMSGNSWNGEVEMYGRNGVKLYILMRAYAVKNENNEIAALVGVHTDITERKRMEEEASRSRLLLRTVLDIVPVHICAKNIEGRFLLVNKNLTDFYGTTVDAMTGVLHSDICEDEEELHAMLQADRAVIESDKPKFIPEETMMHPDGSVSVLETYKLPFFANEEKAVLIVSTDITERKQVEDDLHDLRNYLSNIINSMPSLLIGVDLDGNVTQWNQQTEKETGLSAAQVSGRKLEDVFPNLKNKIDKIKSAIREHQTYEDTKVARLVDGEKRYEDVTVYPLVSGGVEGAVIRVDDVTENVRLEEMIIQSEKMLSVGGLAAGMAHEINNPLAGIIQNTQVLQNRITGIIPKNQKIAEECGTDIETIEKYMKKRGLFEMIEAITESGLRASKIVGNMLSFSRRSDSDFTHHNLSEMLDKAVELASNDYDLKKKYDFRQIDIIRDFDENMPDVLCENIKIQQVILNLLKNATQAINEQGDEAEPPRLTLRLFQEGNNANIEIEDNGPGMTEEVRKRVFEPFFTTKDPGIGTGLGLSVSYFIITKNHNGSMSVESSPGNGAKFIIQLPLTPKAN